MATAGLKYGYLSICGKYGNGPLLIAEAVFIALCLVYPFVGVAGCWGLLLAGVAEPAVRWSAGPAPLGAIRGSRLLRKVQMACVLVTLLIGGGAQSAALSGASLLFLS